MILSNVQDIEVWINHTKKAKVIVEAAEPDTVNLDYYGLRRDSTAAHECGTTYCSLGLVAQDLYFKSLGFDLVPAGTYPPNKVNPRLTRTYFNVEFKGAFRFTTYALDGLFGPDSKYLFAAYNDSIYDRTRSSEKSRDQALHRFDRHLEMLDELKTKAISTSIL